MSPDDFDPQTDAIRAELARFHDDFRPDPGFRPGLDSLADGDYDFDIEHAELTHTPEKKDLILRLALQVVGQPRSLEHVYFFRTQRSVNKLGWDLQSLGFDCQHWRDAGRRFEDELIAAVPRLARKRFTARKSCRKDPASGKDYHDLAIRGAAPSLSAIPAHPGAGLATARPPSGPAVNGPPRPVADVALGSDEEIPF